MKTIHLKKDFFVYAFLSVLLGITISNIITLFRTLFSLKMSVYPDLEAALYDQSFFSLQNLLVFVAMTFACGCWFYYLHASQKDSKWCATFLKILTHPLTVVLLLVFCFRFWYYPHHPAYVLYYDSSSYYEYDYNLLKLQTDHFRTPVYPYFIKLVAFLTGFSSASGAYPPAFYGVLAFVQKMLSFCAVAILYVALRKVIRRRWLVALICLCYGCAPAVISWDICILTESLSFFFMVLMLYCVFSYLRKPSILTAIMLGVVSLIMVLLRPTFIYLIAIFAVFFIARLILCRSEWKKAVSGIVSLGICGLLLLGYCQLNYVNNHYFGISSVGTNINQLYMVIENAYYKNADYPEITNYIEQRIGAANNLVVDIIEPLNEQFDLTEIKHYVKSCLQNNAADFREYTVEKFMNQMPTDIATQYSSNYADPYGNFRYLDRVLLYGLCPFSIGFCFVLVVMTVVLSIFVFVGKKRCLWHAIGLSAFLFSHLFVSIYGSMAEFERLSTVVIPVVLALLCYLIDIVMASMDRKKLYTVLETVSTSATLPAKKAEKEEAEQTQA